MMRFSPTHAVTPGMPVTPSHADSGTRDVSTLRSPAPFDVPYSCQPNWPTTRSPTAKSGWRDSITSPAVPPIITSLSGCGGAYDFASFMRPRMYGSSDRK
ncbi:hypothetical protein FEP65_04879 [Burkholderia multivorans]|nr:hypothetical protein [Burkholderia multivorans]